MKEDLLTLDNLTIDRAEKTAMDREAAKRSQGTLNSDIRISSSYKKNKKEPTKSSTIDKCNI